MWLPIAHAQKECQLESSGLLVGDQAMLVESFAETLVVFSDENHFAASANWARIRRARRTFQALQAHGEVDAKGGFLLATRYTRGGARRVV